MLLAENLFSFLVFFIVFQRDKFYFFKERLNFIKPFMHKNGKPEKENFDVV